MQPCLQPVIPFGRPRLMLEGPPAIPGEEVAAFGPGTEALAAAGVIGTFECDPAGGLVAVRWLLPRPGPDGGEELPLDAFLRLLRPEDGEAALAAAARSGGRFAIPCRPDLPGLASGHAVLRGAWRPAEPGRPAGLAGALVEMPPPYAPATADWPDAIYQHASVGIAELDPATARLVRVNDAYCRLTGFSRTQLLEELKLYDLTHPDDLGREKALRDRLMAGEIGSFAVEKRFRRSDGSYAWAEVSVSLARHGPVLREVRIVQGITGRKQAEAALQESEARFRALFESVPIGLVAVDLGTLRFVSANARAAAQLGYSIEELSALTLAEVEAVQTRRELLARAREIAETPPGTVFQIERRQRCRDGSIRETLISNVRVDAAGRKLVYGAWLDVTEQRAATAALRESEARLRATYEGAPVGIAELDPATRRFLHVNETYARVGGRKVAEYRDLSLADINPPEDLAAEEADRFRLLRGEIDSYRCERRFIRPDGSIGWSEVSVSLVRDAEGAPRREIRVAQDITARHLAEAALREGEERLRLALAAGQVGTFDFDLRTGEVSWDDRTRAMWGVAPGAPVTEETFWAGVHPDDRERVRRVFAATRASGEAGPHEVEHRVVSLADGTERHVASRWRLAMAEGRPARVVGTRVDVTAQRQAAEVLARSNAELERLVEERTAALRRSVSERRALQERIRRTERLDALGQLTGGVAHDFNNLLTAVLGGAEEILDAVPAGHPLREPAETILAGAERGAELTRRLLAFAREQPLKPRDVDVAAALSGMRGLLRRVAGDGVELRLRPARPGRPAAHRPHRSRAARDRGAQPRRQCARRDAGGRPGRDLGGAAAHRGGGGRASARGVCRHLRRRPRHRDGAGGAGPRDGALLHHQGGRARHRARAQHGVRLHAAVGRHGGDRERARARARPSACSCRPRRRRRSRPAPSRHRSGSAGASASWWWRTTRWCAPNSACSSPTWATGRSWRRMPLPPWRACGRRRSSTCC
jgi:PAS domain S-box-containing protein